MVWQRNRLAQGFICSKCHCEVHWDEWDDKEELCLYCEFPEASRAMAAPMHLENGANRNQTEMGYVLENLNDIPSAKSDFHITSQEKKLLTKVNKTHKKRVKTKALNIMTAG